MKSTIHILSFAAVGAFLYADFLSTSAPLNAQVQGRRSTRVDYSKFKHSSHTGAIKAARKGTVQQIDCAYCHGTPTNENPDVLRGYPYRKYGLKSELTHSACSDCHAFTGRDAIVSSTLPTMCLICHQNTRLAGMGKNLRPFPNPVAAESQFFDRYSHKKHAGYFNASETFKDRFKDRGKFKEKDNFECIACHTTNQENIVVAKIQFAPGVKESLPSHRECFVCHFNEQEVTKELPTFFATNCVGCHAVKGQQAGKGSEHSVHWFARQIVDLEKNPAKPGEKATKPFSHETHEAEDVVGKDTKSCLKCHATGKRADKRSDFFLEDRDTKEKQPPAVSCIKCHKIKMEHKIEGTVKPEASGCNYCHSMETIKERAASGVQLPPPNHFTKKAPAAPAPPPKPVSN